MNISFEHSKNKEYLLGKVRWVMYLTVLLFVMLISFGIIDVFVVKNNDFGINVLKDHSSNQILVIEEILSECEGILSESINDTDKEIFFDTEKMKERVSEYSWNTRYLKDYGLVDAEGCAFFKNQGKADLRKSSLCSYEGDSEKAFVKNEIIYGFSPSPICVVPIKENGKSVGYVCGVLSDSILDVSWETNLGGEDTVTFVTDRDLSILFRYDHKGYYGKNNDFDTFLSKAYYLKGKTNESARKSIIEGKNETFKVRYRSMEKLLYSDKSDKYNFYIIKLFPYKSVTAGQRAIKLVLILEVIAAFLVMAGIGGFTYIILLHYRRAAESLTLYDRLNDTFEVATIEYDFLTSKLTLAGCAERTFGIEKKRYEWARVSELYDCVHPEDMGVRETIENAVKNKETHFSAEVRLKRTDGEYEWHRLMAVITNNSSDEPIRFFGYVKKTEAEMDEARAFKRQSEEDLLTGILNKVAVENEVNKAFSEKPDGIFVFFIIDLDNFKSVNDNLGHAKGDEVIRDTAQKLVKVFSINDYVGRIGGDEFAVVMTVPDNMRSKLDSLIDMKVKAISKSLSRTYKKGEIKVSVTASIGIVIRENEKQTFSDLYKMADKALYASKNGGKNKATFYSEL